jgi:uncharacterized protein involved in exopolysaccharide biosynthesis
MAEYKEVIAFKRPRLGVFEIGVHLWRNIGLMLLVFLPIFALGMTIAFMQKDVYVAASRVKVSVGEEYLFRPRVGGDLLNNPVPATEELVQTELELLYSPAIAQRVLDTFGIERLYPELAERLASADADKAYEISERALSELRKDFGAFAPPKKTVISTSFRHLDAQLSADVLNAFMDEYIAYRSTIFRNEDLASFEAQRRTFEGDLFDTEEDMRRFLVEYNIGDFETEKTTVQSLVASIEQAIFTNETSQSELEGQLSVLRDQLATTPEDIDVFVEDSSSQSLVILELEREELLSRYTETSEPVQNINRRIARAREYLDGGARTGGLVRRGPNPLYQTVETSFATLSAQLSAARQQKRVLSRQAAEVQARQKRLAELEPEWQALLRKRDLLESNVRGFSVRETESRTLSQFDRQDENNIKILERARRPAEGESLKLVIAVLSLLFAGFTALIAGLLRALSFRGFVSANSLERTTGLPVVATIAKYK